MNHERRMSHHPIIARPRPHAAVTRPSSQARLWLVTLLPALAGAACVYDYSGLGGNRAEGGSPSQDASPGATDAAVQPDGPSATGGSGRTIPSRGRGGAAGDGDGGANVGTGGDGGTGGAAGVSANGGSSGGGGPVAVAGEGGRMMSAGGGNDAQVGGTGGSSADGAMAGAPSTGDGGIGGRPSTARGTAGTAGDLVLHYDFDEAENFIAADSSGYPGGPRNAVLRTTDTGGSSGFSTDHQVGTHALSLVSSGPTSGGYVTTPPIGDLAPDAMTIALWVKMTSNPLWPRLLDCGDSTDRYFFLTPTENASFVRFAITVSGSRNEQGITSSVRLTPGSWHHVAVVLESGTPYRGTIFVDGAAAGTNPSMVLRPGDLGATQNNYLGRSQFARDPFFDGFVDDFRVYRRALTSDEIKSLFSAR